MDLVERLRNWRDDRREIDYVTMAGQHLNTELLGEAADHIEALEAAITYAAETTNDEHTMRKLFAALGQTVE